METRIYRVVAQGESFKVSSKKQEGGQLSKCMIRLKELNEYGDELLVVMLGNLAECRFAEGRLVAASLRFSTHENNGQYYQDIVANDIVAL